LMWPSATIFSILVCAMPTLIYATCEWGHGNPRILFALAEFDASAVFSGDAAAKNPDRPEPTIVTR